MYGFSGKMTDTEQSFDVNINVRMKLRVILCVQFADEESDTTLLLKALIDDRMQEDLITYHKIKPYQLLVTPNKFRCMCTDQKKNGITSLIQSAIR